MIGKFGPSLILPEAICYAKKGVSRVRILLGGQLLRWLGKPRKSVFDSLKANLHSGNWIAAQSSYSVGNPIKGIYGSGGGIAAHLDKLFERPPLLRTKKGNLGRNGSDWKWVCLVENTVAPWIFLEGWEGEPPGEPKISRLGRSLALPEKRWFLQSKIDFGLFGYQPGLRLRACIAMHLGWVAGWGGKG